MALRTLAHSLWFIAVTLAFALLFPAQTAWAADGGSVDAGVDVPDGSVGQGGADQGQEEDDTTGHVATSCLDNRDCSKGFSCSGRRCVYVGYREADQGCVLGLGAGTAVAAGLILMHLRRQR